MDKADVKHEVQSDTSSVINMKEYAPSEYPSSEPPPAYMKVRPNSLRIARLAAFTVLASAVILGSFILAASWIQANTARNLDLTLNQELMDDMHPTYEHLVANELLSEPQDNSLNQETSQDKKQEGSQPTPPPQEETLQPEEPDTRQPEGGASLELDAIANVLMQKGMRGNVNCIVEKRRNEELVDHAPRALNLPGINITTPPRLQHLTGEQVVIICKDENNSQEEKEEEKDEPMMLPIPPQILQQIQQSSQMIPLAQILQHLQAAQQQQQQVQQERQIFFQPQQMFHQPQPQQQVFHQPQPQQQVFQQIYPSQPQPQPQQVFYPQQQQQQQQQMFVPHQQVFYRQQPQFRAPVQEMQRPPMPLHQVPLNQLMSPRPINPMAIQDVPVNQMPITHMPMRDARMPEQPIPVHHLVPPRPQQVRIENFSQNEDDLPAIIRQRLLQREQQQQVPRMFIQREREMPRNVMTEANPQPLALEAREPRLLNEMGPGFPINDNHVAEAPQQPISPRFPPPRRFRFPEAPEPQGMAITRIIPIRLEKIQDSEEENSAEEKRPPPIPINAILDMVFRGIRPLVGRQPFPVPIDIKIERIQKQAMPEMSVESEESQEDSQEGQEEPENMDEKSEAMTEAKAQQVEIVEEETDNAQAIPIPADAKDAQIFKLDEKTGGEWVGRSFLPNGQGRGGVFPIPQGIREAQIFTVSDARAVGEVPMTASFEAAAPKEEEEEASQEARVVNIGQPEGEVNLFPVPMNAERSVRLYPVQEPSEKQQEQKMEQPDQQQDKTIVEPR